MATHFSSQNPNLNNNVHLMRRPQVGLLVLCIVKSDMKITFSKKISCFFKRVYKNFIHSIAQRLTALSSEILRMKCVLSGSCDSYE